MKGLKDYISNDALCSLEDLIELGNSYKKIFDSNKKLGIKNTDDFLYNMDCITRELNRRTKQQ